MNTTSHAVFCSITFQFPAQSRLVTCTRREGRKKFPFSLPPSRLEKDQSGNVFAPSPLYLESAKGSLNLRSSRWTFGPRESFRSNFSFYFPFLVDEYHEEDVSLSLFLLQALFFFPFRFLVNAGSSVLVLTV